jgi:hypothetical protein
MSFGELWDAAVQVFSATDLIRLSLLVIILLLAGFLMPSFGSILNATALALVAFAAAMYVRSLMGGGQDAVGLAKSDWDSFLALDGKTLFVYALSFAVVISAVFFVRAMFSRG